MRTKSKWQNWYGLSLVERIHWLRLLLPPLLVVLVVVYQLGIAQALGAAFGHTVHYSVEIAFYSLVGPVVTWLMLAWVESKLREKEQLERQIQAAQKEKSAVLEEERARIARDLHDGVAQTLYFLALKTDVLRQQLAGNEAAVSELKEMGQTTRHVIQDVRRTIFAIRPLDWSEAGFLPGLETFIRQFAEQTGWQTSLQIDPSLSIPSRLEPTIFRIVQESLNNVAKHAGATEIAVRMALVNDDNLKLNIVDNGQGFDPAKANGGGFGLQQMGARVANIGGDFNISSELDSGTTVTAVLPTRENTP